MDQCFEKFERNRHSFVPKAILRNFKRMKLQYDKIKAVEEDDEKWGEAILEVDNEEFIEHNIEFRLGQDLTNKKLWKIYLEYLKSHDQQKLLQAYSKYCRFFLDDTEMFEEYRIAAGNQKVRVPWKNPFDFEVYDEDFYHRRHEYVKRNYVQKAPLKCHFTAENTLNQGFPFKSTLMNYIIKNANARVLHDLFKSCKWFYLKNPVTICYKFEVGRSTSIEIKDQYLSVSTFLSFSQLLEKVFISSHLIIAVSQCSVLIPRIYRCTAKYVELCFQRFTDEELDKLIGYGNVMVLRLNEVKNLNDEFFKLEKILQMVPKIQTLRVIGIQCTSNTSQALCNLAFENKIGYLSITNIYNDSFEPNAFAEFINKNVAAKTSVNIGFNSKTDESFVLNFISFVKAAITEYWVAECEPKFYLDRF